MTQLRLTNVAVGRGGIRRLEGLSLTLAPGQALIIRGPNGIGKTTLLRAIAGLAQFEEGTLEVPAESFAYAGHADGMKASMTARQNLTFWRDLYRQDVEIDDALEQMSLSYLAEHLAGRLSAGQRRRLGLARLLVVNRPIWLLDEPTVSLDTASTALFADCLRAHLAAGGSALIATHIDLGLSAEVLDLGPYRAKPRAAAGGFDEAFT